MRIRVAKGFEHVCDACGKRGVFGPGWRYPQAPPVPYDHPLVRMVACSEECERLLYKRYENARV